VGECKIYLLKEDASLSVSNRDCFFNYVA